MSEFKVSRFHIFLIVTCLTAFVAALYFDNYYTLNNNLKRYRNYIETDLHHQENNVDKLFNNTELNKQLLSLKFNQPSPNKLGEIDTLLKPEESSFTYLIFADSIYQFWSKTECPLPKESELAKIKPIYRDSIAIYEFNNSYYELRLRSSQIIFENSVKPVLLCALIPIKRSYSNFEGEFLNKHFAASADIPVEINVSEHIANQSAVTLNLPIITQENKTLCFINCKENVSIADNKRDRTIGGFLLIGFFILGYLFNKLAQKIIDDQNRSRQSWVFFFVLLGGLRFFVFWVQTNISLPTLGINPEVFSPQQIWIETFFFFWFANFISKNFRTEFDKNLADKNKVILTLLFLLMSVTFFNIFILVSNYIVTRLDHALSFDNLVNFNVVSVLTISALGLMLISILMFSLRMVEAIKKLQLGIGLNALLLAEALLFGCWVFSNFTAVPIYIHFAFSIVFFALLFCFQVEKVNYFFLNLVLLLFFSTSISGLIWEFNNAKDVENLVQCAQELIKPTDEIAVKNLDSLRKAIIQSVVLPDAVLKEDQKQYVLDSLMKDIRSSVKKILDCDPYLNSHYDLSYNINNEILNFSRGTTTDSTFFLNQARDATKVKERPEVYVNSNSLNAQYFTYAHLKSKNDPDADVYVSIRCTRNDKVSTVLYGEILPQFTYKGVRDLKRYSYDTFRADAKNVSLPPGIVLNRIKPNSFVTYSGKKEIGLFHRFTLEDKKGKKTDEIIKVKLENRSSRQFQSLWTQTVLIVLSLGISLIVLNHLFKFLPNYREFFIRPINDSISTRIIVVVSVALFFLFLIIFSAIESLYKSTIYNIYQTEIKPNIKSSLDQTGQKISQIWTKSAGYKRQNLIDSLIQNEKADKSESLHFYGSNGKEISSTGNILYNNGLNSDYMDAKTFWDMTSQKLPVQEATLSLGKFNYRSVFVAVRDSNNIPIGFLEKMFYSSYRKSQSDLGSARVFTVFLLTVLFFLILLIIYLLINRWVIKPIQNVAGNLEKLDLANISENEVIEYRYNDEIKILVSAHNKLLPELKGKIKLIEENQRNLAFRQMAEQIAHDIKNPLSPINMGAQLLLSLGDDFDPTEFREQTRLNMRAIIDQVKVIDRLTRDLKNFALGSENAKNEIFDLNEAILSVKNLMEAEFKSKKIRFNVMVPKEKLFIYADSIIIKRALTNLVKNGEQAIPSTTHGLINIYLEQVGDNARITISDNGTGIADEVKDKLFDATITTKATGSGLGLAITKQIVLASNGSIRFETRKNIGTDFILEFPIKYTEQASSARIDDEVQPSVAVRSAHREIQSDEGA